MWMSIPEMAKISGIGAHRIRGYIRNGMRFYQERDGGQITVRLRDLEEYREKFARKIEEEMPEEYQFLIGMIDRKNHGRACQKNQVRMAG